MGSSNICVSGVERTGAVLRDVILVANMYAVTFFLVEGQHFTAGSPRRPHL